jgi:hypothetical protein
MKGNDLLSLGFPDHLKSVHGGQWLFESGQQSALDKPQLEL